MVTANGAGMTRMRRKFSPEQLEDLKEMERNGKWFNENHSRLQLEYPNSLVAIHSDSVLAAAETLDELISRLRKVGAPRLTQVLIRYVPDEHTILIY